MENYAELAHDLVDLLRLDLVPVSISFSDAPPAGVKEFDGQAPAGCRFWEDATTSSFTTSAFNHELCAIGVHTHNLSPSPSQQEDLIDALKVFADLGYVRAEDVPQIPVLKSAAKFVTYSPLGTTPLPPSVVLLFVRADQTLILSEATQQIESANLPAMGRPACAVVAQVIKSGAPAMSLGCCGARAYLDSFTEEKAIFAIPGRKIGIYVDKIRALTKANGILSQFHQLRRTQIAAGARPSIKESLAAFSAQS
jgi:uncharacterized protein (DUF169 family)